MHAPSTRCLRAIRGVQTNRSTSPRLPPRVFRPLTLFPPIHEATTTTTAPDRPSSPFSVAARKWQQAPHEALLLAMLTDTAQRMLRTLKRDCPRECCALCRQCSDALRSSNIHLYSTDKVTTGAEWEQRLPRLVSANMAGLLCIVVSMWLPHPMWLPCPACAIG